MGNNQVKQGEMKMYAKLQLLGCVVYISVGLLPHVTEDLVREQITQLHEKRNVLHVLVNNASDSMHSGTVEQTCNIATGSQTISGSV